MITPDELAERMKAEILTDVRTGVMPATVSSFSQLHDYVDANCYGGTENPAKETVDAWIKAGGVFQGIAETSPGTRKIIVYRRNDQDQPLVCIGEERPPAGEWFIRASAELNGGNERRALHLMGRNFLIYSSEHARDPEHLGMAVEHFGAAAKKLGYSLPLNEETAPCWLTYTKDDMDAGAPADEQFMLGQIATVFGKDAAQAQADALGIKWPARIAGTQENDRSL